MLRFEIALVSVWWDKDSIDNMWFPDPSDQLVYMEYLADGKYSTMVNFNMNDNITTTQYFRDENKLDPLLLIESNYAIVRRRLLNNEGVEVDPSTRVYRFFFAKCTQDCGRQFRVDLELDDIQTNYIKYKDKIRPCIINRAHLDRFGAVDNKQISFNLGVDSPLFAESTDNLPKRLVKRTKLNFYCDLTSETSGYNTFMKNGVIGWVLLYFNPSVANIEGLNSLSKYYINEINTNYILCVAPIIKQGQFEAQGNIADADALFRIVTVKELAAHVINMKLSPIIPFNVFKYVVNYDYEMIAGGAGFNIKLPANFNINIVPVQVGSTTYSLLNLRKASSTPAEAYYNTNNQYTFNTRELIGNYSPVFNPYYLSAAYRECRIVDYAGNSFAYDHEKIGRNYLTFLATENYSADISKAYYRLKTNAGEVYDTGTMYNYMGLVTSNDTSIPFNIDQLNTFLANNKNYFLQQQTSRNYALGRSVVDSLSSVARAGVDAASGNLTGAGINSVGAVSSLIGGTLDYAESVQQQAYTINNLECAPQALQNVQGNIFQCLLVNGDLGIYIEEYECLPADGLKYLHYQHLYGFAYGRVGKITDFDHLRAMWNYISAEVNIIDAPISNLEKERLRHKLRNCRLWIQTARNFTLENYERKLVFNV